MKNEIYTVECLDLTFAGYGVAKVNDLVVFVKGLLIGEKAVIKLIALRKNYAYAIIEKLLEVSPYRTASICPIAYKCGGCDLCHINYAYQLVLKQKWVRETLKSVAGIELPVKAVVPAPRQYAYRNKVQLPLKDGKIGFYRKHSHDIVEYTYCCAQSPLANKIIAFLKQELKARSLTESIRHIVLKEGFACKEVMVAFVTGENEIKGLDHLVTSLVQNFPAIKSVILSHKAKDDNVVLGEEETLLFGRPYINDSLKKVKYQISLKSFYQINPYQTVNLYQEIIKRAEIGKTDRVLDLYSGIGSIALFIAAQAGTVTGVEIEKAAVENARKNAVINAFKNVRFYLGDAAAGLKDYLVDQDIVIVDPPRKGLNPAVIKEIAAAETMKVVYVSCNPSTLARDLKLFIESGYTADYLQPFDMFPHTRHVECVTLLKRKG